MYLGRKRNRIAVYPRVCGGTALFVHLREKIQGLSPRVRGNRAFRTFAGENPGSIPACAGEPPPPRRESAPTRVYPRVCGGTGRCASNCTTSAGLSPRVRGNQLDLLHRAAGAGSIPACAGEPLPAWAWAGATGVYPRVCGGTSLSMLKPTNIFGLSPRVRGNLCAGTASPLCKRSIPACAGEPAWMLARCWPH